MPYRCIWLLLISASLLECLTLIDSDPSNSRQRALMARYVIHVSDWISLSTISTVKSIQSYPFVNLQSMSDGPISQSTGIPYIYTTSLDLSAKDLNSDDRCSVLASLAQSDYCKEIDVDPQDPRCAKVILSGHFITVKNSSEEYEFAKNALFSRHPKMRNWPTAHNFYFGKIEIEHILILDDFGGASTVDREDYFNANITLLNDFNF